MNKNEFLSTLKLASALKNKQNEVRITVMNDKKNIEVRAMKQEIEEQISLIPSRIKKGTKKKEKRTMNRTVCIVRKGQNWPLKSRVLIRKGRRSLISIVLRGQS
jgi:hypothetical protein